ncbi:MAG: DUF1003 domain-containing protein [Proteobacteria bacterium]|nr:DUF1003 domain-containing protein [Pseudomonadota bacterium]MBU1742571.1 DUF1003 domain-containing protein [Pseudomonadota bacterium]
MSESAHKKVACQICGQPTDLSEVMPAEMVRPVIVEVIKTDHPDWSTGGYICHQDLSRFRTKYIQNVLEAEKGELSNIEKEVVASLQQHELLSKNINDEFNQRLTFGERLSDRIAEFGGSWRFIISFLSIMLFWIAANVVVWLWKPFDPYPFILLNLVLSCLAALQAPIIMMSQNRQEAKDRFRAENDYRVNLKAELEIRHIQQKVDHLLMSQWQRLMQVQDVQMQLLEELVPSRREKT